MPKKNLMDEVVGGLNRSMDQAVAGARRISGVPNDPDVRFYQSLKEDDLEFIRQTYGAEAMSRYVRAMELRNRNS